MQQERTYMRVVDPRMGSYATPTRREGGVCFGAMEMNARKGTTSSRTVFLLADRDVDAKLLLRDIRVKVVEDGSLASGMNWREQTTRTSARGRT
jgi:hypothetical protein